MRPFDVGEGERAAERCIGGFGVVFVLIMLHRVRNCEAEGQALRQSRSKMSLKLDWVAAIPVDERGKLIVVRWVPAASSARSVMTVSALLDSLLSDSG